MLFNSWRFIVFFPTVVALYFLLPARRRWMLLLAASYYFYMCWKVEYIALLLASTLVDYFAGLKMGALKSRKERLPYLVFSLIMNLGLLFFFKYFDFAGATVEAAFRHVNLFCDMPAFNFLLPVGISFYTFQTLSYAIEVYWGRIEPERHLGRFALYVAFFPQLVAGPIERPDRLLPQFQTAKTFDYGRFQAGLIRMLWGFYKKLVIADRLALVVNRIYGSAASASPEELLMGTYFFAFQIYCDFSGYTDIAIGTARILGYDLMENFDRPYYSKSISEFWRRWHISLSSWIRDYLFIPLYVNAAAADGAVSRARHALILMAILIISGLWHGASWTFALWGAYHGVLLAADARMTQDLFGGSRLARAAKALATFHLVCFGWIFFRAETVSDAFLIAGKILRFGGAWTGALFADENVITALCAIFAMEAAHGIARREDLENFVARRAPLLRWAFYLAVTWAIILCGEFASREFIYFRF